MLWMIQEVVRSNPLPSLKNKKGDFYMAGKKGLYLDGIISGIKTKDKGKTDALFEFLDEIEDSGLSYGGTSLTEFDNEETTLQLQGTIFNVNDDNFTIDDLKKVLEDKNYKYEGQVIPVESMQEEKDEKEN